MSKRELWNEMADWLTDAFSFFERCLSNWKNFRVKVSGLVRLPPTVNLAFRDMYQIHWGLLTCLGMRDIYSGAYMSRNPRHILTSVLKILSQSRVTLWIAKGRVATCCIQILPTHSLLPPKMDTDTWGGFLLSRWQCSSFLCLIPVMLLGVYGRSFRLDIFVAVDLLTLGEVK